MGEIPSMARQEIFWKNNLKLYIIWAFKSVSRGVVLVATLFFQVSYIL